MAHIEKRNGRYRARYRGSDGRERSKTFDRRADAERFLAEVEVDKARGLWIDPSAGQIKFEKWFDEWIAGVPLGASTLSLYSDLARNHLLPTFGDIPLNKITTTDVRRWLTHMWEKKVPGREKKLDRNTVAKAYRLLSRVMSVAAADGLIGRSPCTIAGAGTERTPEMKFASAEQIHALAAAVPDRFRALILVAGFGGLRWGELAGLRRARVDLLHGTVKVAEQLTEVNGNLAFGPPKTDSSHRTVALPTFVVQELETHLDNYVGLEPDDLVFSASTGDPLRRSNFRRREWLPAVEQVGVEGLRFHDLRHSAGTLAAQTGATTRELMARLGHSSPRAALIYQHATAERDAAIAAGLDALAASPRPEADSEVEAEVLDIDQQAV